tara:strand:- start:30 stop:308 length:279 start_codon:yes stop_codon:yes gene_type:complete
LHGWISTALGVMLIPGANLLTDITTSHPAMQWQGHLLIAVLDGVEGDAAAAIHHERFRNRRRGTGREAALAMAAEGAGWLIGWKAGGGEQVA